jgi:UDP-glucose:(heptosyl)LPS alpha-1,3-glucosyltransferase
MERYVWELSRALADRGYQLHVLCEELCSDKVPDGIQVHSLGPGIAKPRWLGHVVFSRRVTRWWRQYRQPGWLLHSHERCAVHDLTTFHGPPFAPVRERPLWKRLSLRVWVNLRLEEREVNARGVGLVVPCSTLIGDQLRRYYPDAAARVTHPILPGVEPLPARPSRPVASRGGVMGFIGFEWKRKGLDVAVDVARLLMKQRPDLEFWVAGASRADIQSLFAGYEGKVRFLGRVDPAEFYSGLDLLIHPARQEPFGMVVMEAMAARVRVIISSECGSQSEVTAEHGRVLSLDADRQAWADACDELLTVNGPRPGYARPWGAVAREYDALYRRIAAV